MNPDQPRALTGRFTTNDSPEAHAALITRALAAKQERYRGLFGPAAPAPAPLPAGSPIPSEGGYRTPPPIARDHVADHNALIASMAQRTGTYE
jgi:hypothetical protein